MCASCGTAWRWLAGTTQTQLRCGKTPLYIHLGVHSGTYLRYYLYKSSPSQFNKLKVVTEMAQLHTHQWCLTAILMFIQFPWYTGLRAAHIPADDVLASS